MLEQKPQDYGRQIRQQALLLYVDGMNLRQPHVILAVAL
jgi:hypothetical protein